MKRGHFALCLLSVWFVAVANGREPNQPWNEAATSRGDAWFYSQRAFPLGFIPPGVRQAAIAEMRGRRESGPTKLTIEKASTTAKDATPWKSIGPQPTTLGPLKRFSGRVTALVVNPRDSNVVYLGSAQGGVWKTTNGGTTWTPLTDFEASPAIGSIAIDPSNPDIVYAGTGEQNLQDRFNDLFYGFKYSYFGAGLLKSTDAGRTWTNLASHLFGGARSETIGGATIGAIAINPEDGRIVLAGVQTFPTGPSSGIYRSTDGGLSWKNVLPGGAGTAVFFDVANPHVAYAALGTAVPNNTPPNGIYKSMDAGQTWVSLMGHGGAGLPSTSTGRISLVQAPSKPRILYASVTDESSLSLASFGVFRSQNGGQSWTLLPNSPTCPFECDYVNVIAVDPADSSVVYVGGVALRVSTNGGATWSAPANADDTHADFHALAFDAAGKKLYVGNDGGVWSTTRPADPAWLASGTWDQLNDTLALTQFYPGISIDPNNVNRGFGGTQDNGTQRYSGSKVWEWVVGFDAAWTAIDPVDPNTVYSSFSCGYNKSTTGGGGLSFGFSWLTTNFSGRCGFLPPLVIDPVDSRIVYFGTYRVLQSLDKGATWTPISLDLTACVPGPQNNFGPGCPTVTTIAVAPSASTTVYAGTQNGKVQMTRNADAHAAAVWTDRSSGLPPRYVTQIAVHPADDQTAFVTFSGFSGFVDLQGHVFKTTDGGATWSDISGNLPNTPVNDIIIDANLADALYVGTDVGVFISLDGGGNWFPLGSGLPLTAVTSMKIHRATRTLRAATFGRSMWDFDLDRTPLYDLRRDSTTGSSMLGTIATGGIVSDRFAVGRDFDALTFSSTNVAYGANLFYYLRHDAVGASTFGTIALDGTVTDRFAIGSDFDALAFVAPDLGYGPNLFYYIRHDASGFSTFGTIAPSGAIVDRFGVGFGFRALTFAAGDLGYGANLFYYLRSDAGATNFGTISTLGTIVDRFGVGANFEALAFTPLNLGYGSNLFYYTRRDPASGASTFGTISTSGRVIDRFQALPGTNALTIGPP